MDSSKTLINKEQVEKVAQLTKLDISEQEEKLVTLFNETLDYIKILDQLDTSNVPETYQVTGLTNVYQKEGEQNNTLPKEGVLKNAKDNINNLFATKAVFDR